MLLVKTYLAESSNKGLGLFAEEFIPKNTTIWQFIEGFDIKVHKEKYKTLTEIQKNHIDKYFWREGDYYYSSCDHSIFQNHSNNPNSIELDKDKMIAARDIYPNEEIVVCYENFDDDFDIYKNILIWEI
jgi:SET domain-containing protein